MIPPTTVVADEENGLSVSDGSKHDNTTNEKTYLGDKYYITVPWSLQYYLTIRGSENLHIYLWIAKDLAWTQDSYWPAMLFGIFALLWCLVLFYNAFKERSIDEMYMLVAMVLWLMGNFLWMAGETFRGDDDYVAPRTGIIMETAIAWILLYHVVLRPLKIIPRNERVARRYEVKGLKPRFSYFENWRQYEHLHTLCWLGKDLSWNRMDFVTWCIFLVPTVLLAVDFIWSTYRTKKMMIDTVHYFSQLMWVFGNGTWSMGEIIVNRDGDDNAIDMWQISREGQQQCRYWAAWILFSAYGPLVLFYCFWLYLTVIGEVRPEEPDVYEDEEREVARAASGDKSGDKTENQEKGLTVAAVTIQEPTTSALHSPVVGLVANDNESNSDGGCVKIELSPADFMVVCDCGNHSPVQAMHIAD